MSTTTQNIQNYFGAFRGLLNTSLETYKSSLSNDWDGFKAKTEAKIISSRLDKALKHLEKEMVTQQERLENIEPKEFQKEVGSFLGNLETVIDEGYKMIKENLEKQKKYVATNQFLEDAEKKSEEYSKAYNMLLVSAKAQIDSFSKQQNQTDA